MCYVLDCVKYYLIIALCISITIVYFVRKRILDLANIMSLCKLDDQLSDDEVYFGKLTLKELKKRILWDKESKSCGVSAVNSPKHSEDLNSSLKILQAHSQPNLISGKGSSNLDNSELDNSACVLKTPDDSFLKLENMVEELCVSPKSSNKAPELNNTLEVIEYILNNPPSCSTTHTNEKLKNKNQMETQNNDNKTDHDNIIYLSPQRYHTKLEENKIEDSPELPQITPAKTLNSNKSQKHIENYQTPRLTKPKSIFKTPAQPLSLKKASATSLKKTPSKSNAYQHISSPVASYIKNCPIVPLVKDVHPKKPLPGPSSIPKFVKNPIPVKPSNKENIILPSVAYKSAKKTKVIEVPDDTKLPQCQWAKKLATTLAKPMVMKHNHRELNFAKKKLMGQQEDSFADLSYHQAEVSVCTQKSAFKGHKHF